MMEGVGFCRPRGAQFAFRENHPGHTNGKEVEQAEDVESSHFLLALPAPLRHMCFKGNR